MRERDAEKKRHTDSLVDLGIDEGPIILLKMRNIKLPCPVSWGCRIH